MGTLQMMVEWKYITSTGSHFFLKLQWQNIKYLVNTVGDGDTPNEGRVEIYHKYRKSLFLKLQWQNIKYLVNTVGDWEQYAVTIVLQLTDE